ncbi:very-long-chain 3-oxoacyl-CoA reductase-like isoform X1 [Dromiciops gliroides]|uniref:very-long-chain 3-oxoacyl-CoA reductase-like isoform X1 n=1 Tax=Dromiciops gliroides TaxID=33562 RepID=UPI001CC6D3B7|nr:very-long-chain 3-oxoacyl-CoA reductase-like isoform X1 [Dromiciops gliroides]
MVPWMKQEGSALEVLGALAAAWWLLWGAWWLGHALIVYGLPQVGLGLGISLKKQGAWAVVTGATSGIGRSYAHELARRGLNIVLISRDMSKLCREAEEIERLHGKETRIIQVDFTGGLEIYEAVESALKGLEIGILVNNVGMFGKNAVRKLLDQEDLGKGITDIINCNMLSVSQMTRIILPQMIARGCGVIINISSEFGKYPVPFTTMYGATKAFINSFSQSVAIEYQSSGVIVQTLTPLMVSSNMNQLETKRFVVMSPEAFVREALDTVGVSNFTSGCLIHFIQSLLLSPFFSNSKYIFWIVNFFQPLLRAFRRP